jgi:translation initiation factor IF-3
LIRITPIRLVGPDGEAIGVVETPQALKMAQEAGLDLVEIVPDTRPPVCKIMDFGKFKYDESKKVKSSSAPEMKELRLGKSVKIDEHDVDIRINQARRFFMEGHKVMFTQRFKGREIAHREIGLANLARVRDALVDIAKVEQPPRWEGRAASIIMAPDRVKVEALKRKLEKEAVAAGKRPAAVASGSEAAGAEGASAAAKKKAPPTAAPSATNEVQPAGMPGQ